MAEDDNVRIFAVETRFHKLARESGGMPREAAIAAAKAHIERAKPGFDGFVDTEMAALAAALEGLRDGRPAAEWVAEAELHSRNLRDVGTTMGSELLTFVAESLCEVLDAVAAGAACTPESITCHFDALVLTRQPQYRGLRPDQVPELAAGLRRVVDRVSTTSG